jgi:hypothetical protein
MDEDSLGRRIYPLMDEVRAGLITFKGPVAALHRALQFITETADQLFNEQLVSILTIILNS